VARRVAAQAQGDLLVLERTVNERGVLRQQIAVDDVRRTVSFFGSTAGEGGWRVAIVDAVDELNASGANALLKILEEPPQRALFLLVSHAPARVLPTIQSRCRKLRLRPLAAPEVAKAVAASIGKDARDPAVREAADAADGSASRALTLLGGDALGLHQRTVALLNSLPHVDQKALHALGDVLGAQDRTAIAAFMDTIDRWMSERLQAPDANANLARLARLAEVWEKVTRAARDTEAFNLERKPLVFSVFGLLADVAR
jgi:DNA polymerase III subunit delta'